MLKIIKQRKTTLFNGKNVKEGDRVLFVDSDGYKHDDVIRRRENDCTHADTGKLLKRGTLYFWNNSFNPSDYKSADIVFNCR